MSWFGRKVTIPEEEGDPTPEDLRRAELSSPLGEEVKHRIWYPRPHGDMTNPNEVDKWAMSVRRPGEGCGDSDYMAMNQRDCQYIARCVAIAEELERAGPDQAKLARQALLLREEREQLRSLAQQLLQTAGAIGTTLNKHDANVVAGVWGTDSK